MQEINLYQLLKFYLKYWYVIALCILAGLIAGYIFNKYIQVPLYRSDATLLVVSSNHSITSQDPVRINNYVELFKSRRVLDPVITQQKLDLSYPTLLERTTATSEKETEIIKVSIATNEANISKELVDGAIVSFEDQAAKIYGENNIQVVDTASLPLEPYNVKTNLQLILSATFGLMAAVVCLFLGYDYRESKYAHQFTVAQNKVVRKKTVARSNKKRSKRAKV